MTAEICDWIIKGRKGKPDRPCVLPKGTHQRHRDQAWVDMQHNRDHTEYRARPEVAARMKQYNKDRWRSSEDYRETRRQRKRSEEYKAARRAYRKRAEVKAREDAYRREYEAKPEVRERIRSYARTRYTVAFSANPESYLKHTRRRRARMRKVLHVDWTRQQVAAVYGSSCYICGGLYEHSDHVVPISRGGPDILPNLRPICRPCNSRKHNSMPPPELLQRVLLDSILYYAVLYANLRIGLDRSSA